MMPARHAMPLAAAAKLFRELRACNNKSIHKTGDLNASDLADCIEKALQDEVNRRGIMLAIAEFVGAALDGQAIDPKTWKPLDRLTPRR
jgi:hypothetical protein